MDPVLPDHASGFMPTVSEEYAEQIQLWHERAYREGRSAGKSEQTSSYLGLTIVVPPEVMPVTPMSHLLGEAVLAHTCDGDRVLDMGTGSGINAVLAATRGAGVLAVDTNPRALDAAQANAARNGVADRIEVRHSDLFSQVDGTFDLIVFDPPFRWFSPRDLLETAMEAAVWKKTPQSGGASDSSDAQARSRDDRPPVRESRNIRWLSGP